MTIAPSSVPPGRFAGCTSLAPGFEGEFTAIRKHPRLRRGAGSLRRAAWRVRAARSSRGLRRSARRSHCIPPAARPCHCDPTGRNMLDDGEAGWLVDWEYSGMNDPMWDLAYFSIESAFDPGGERSLLAAYFGRRPACQRGRRGWLLLKPVAQVLAALWALIQIAKGKTGGDFSGYARARLRPCGCDTRSSGYSRAC